MAVAKKTILKAPEQKQNDSGFFCYIGPSIRGLIQNGAIYIGTREEALKSASAAITYNPLVRTLIVPGDTLAVDRINVKKPGNALYSNYQRILRGQ